MRHATYNRHYNRIRVHSGDSHPHLHNAFTRLEAKCVIYRNISGSGSATTEFETSIDDIVKTVERSVPRSEPKSLCSPEGCRFRILVVGRVGYFLLLRLVPPMLTILSLALESHH